MPASWASACVRARHPFVVQGGGRRGLARSCLEAQSGLVGGVASLPGRAPWLWGVGTPARSARCSDDALLPPTVAGAGGGGVCGAGRQGGGGQAVRAGAAAPQAPPLVQAAQRAAQRLAPRTTGAGRAAPRARHALPAVHAAPPGQQLPWLVQGRRPLAGPAPFPCFSPASPSVPCSFPAAPCLPRLPLARCLAASACLPLRTPPA